MNRKLLWAVFGIGLVLAIAPFALLLPTKASAGEDMLNGFQPIMRPDQVATTARYYNDVFVPLGQVTPMMSAKNLAKFQGYMQGFEGMQTDSAKLVPLLAQALNMTPAQVQQMMAEDLPSMAAMLQTLPQMRRDFGGLLSTMQANEDNYADVNSLPSFRLFAWFFVVPGVLLIAIASYGLWTGRKEATHAAHHARPTPA